MGKVLPALTDGLRGFIERQHLFFVASAPLSGGHLNLSPKGMDAFRVLLPGDADWAALAPLFPTRPRVRQIVLAEISRAQTSCGEAVPSYGYAGERDQLVEWATGKGADGLAAYQREKNAASIDGLPTPLGAGRSHGA